MRLHRFFVGCPLQRGKLFLDDRELLRQWESVLRLRSGDRVILCDGQGSEADAVLTSLTRTSGELAVADVRPVAAEPQRAVTLCCAVLKRENFEWVVQKATEVGVREIIPLLTERTVKTGLKLDRLRLIAKEAAEQSGRGVIPVIHEPEPFAAAIKRFPPEQCIFFHITSTPNPSPTPSTSPILWIGPEGGWSPEEVSAASGCGFRIASLGSLTLRAETAAITAAYLGVQGKL